MNQKRILLLGAFTVAAFSAGAQATGGTITYDEAYHMNIEVPAEAAAFKDLFPKEMHAPHTLTYSADATVYKAQAQSQSVADEKKGGLEGGDFKVQINMSTPEETVYTDLKTGKITEQTELFTRKFLIVDDAQKRAWHNTGRKKDILGYTCQEAISTTGKDTVTAWFTTDIPLSAGPKDWSGLPGMILEGHTSSKESSVVVTAVKIEPGTPDIPAAPKAGKKVTREEFEAIAEAKKKEMQKEFGGNGNMIIHVEEN